MNSSVTAAFWTSPKSSKLKKPPKKDLKLKTYRGCKERQLQSGIFAVSDRRYSRVFINLYDFEHKYLRPKMKRPLPFIEAVKQKNSARWLADDHGNHYHTTDGGQTWTRVDLQAP